jgi:hypothetical protein
MSARKLHISDPDSSVVSDHKRLSLSASAVQIRKSGIEFRASDPIPAWTEMSVDLQLADAKKVHCTGVVVACDGNPQSGYLVSLLFTHLSRQSMSRLTSLAHS